MVGTEDPEELLLGLEGLAGLEDELVGPVDLLHRAVADESLYYHHQEGSV